MVISVRNLRDNMGVDEKIARFFVDRNVPAGNAFWEKRYLYINRGNGYVSIPVYYDLLFRLGMSLKVLLEEEHIQFMEQVMHFAILEEWQQISFAGQIENIQKLLVDRIKNRDFYLELMAYLAQPVLKPMGKLGMEIPGLNRADVFLFILCDLPLVEEKILLAIKYWYALHSTYLLMDDMYDYQIDRQNGDQNAIIELGDNKDAFEKAFGILHRNIEVMMEINPLLSGYFEKSIDMLLKIPN